MDQSKITNIQDAKKRLKAIYGHLFSSNINRGYHHKEIETYELLSFILNELEKIYKTTETKKS